MSVGPGPLERAGPARVCMVEFSAASTGEEVSVEQSGGQPGSIFLPPATLQSLRPPHTASVARAWAMVVCLCKDQPEVISDAQCSGNVNRSIWLTYRGLSASLSKQAVSWFTHR